MVKLRGDGAAVRRQTALGQARFAEKHHRGVDNQVVVGADNIRLSRRRVGSVQEIPVIVRLSFNSFSSRTSKMPNSMASRISKMLFASQAG